MTEATQEMLEGLRRETFNSEQVSYVMLQVRKELASRKEWNGKFRVLSFYCDWCAHHQLDHAKRAETFIRELNQCLWQLDDNGNFNPNGVMDVHGFLRIQQLRTELGIVLSAMSGEVVKPSLTFVLAIFKYLKNIPFVPVDGEKGIFKKGNKKYEKLCADLNVSPLHPLLKNFMITEVQPAELKYQVEMEEVPSTITGYVDFPQCSDAPFIFLFERKKEDEFSGLVNRAQELFQRKQLDSASVVLSKAKTMLSEVRGMDEVKARLHLLSMDVEWSRFGNLDALLEGEEAMKYIADAISHVNIYCQMSSYALQRIDQFHKEALAKAREYIDKSLSYEVYDQFKARPLHIKGRIMAASGSSDEAMDAYTEAARYAEESHLEAEHALIRCDMAQLLDAMGHPEMSLAEFTHAEHIAKDSADPIVMAACAFRKAQFLIKIGDKETACQLIALMPQII